MRDWTPPDTRIRTVPSLASCALTPALNLWTDRPNRGRYDNGLWLRMRRLLPPVFWHAWLNVPRSVRQAQPHGFMGSAAPIVNYDYFILRLRDLATGLNVRGVQVTVGQAACWIIAFPQSTPAGLASRIEQWSRVDLTGQGWLPAAAGLTIREYRVLQYAGGPLPTPEDLLLLTSLRGHLLPHPDQVPSLLEMAAATR